MQVHHDEGVANRIDPESCADTREGIGEALTGERIGQQVFRDVKIGLVERERFDDRRVLGEDLPDLLRDRLVDLESRLHEDEIRAPPLGRHRRRGGSHPKLAGFVACRCHHSAFARSADGDRLAAKLRIIALLDGRIEGIHVDVDDLSLPELILHHYNFSN